MAKKKKTNQFFKHLKKVGFSNRLAIYVLFFLFIGLVGGFTLALISIKADYLGALACWTVVFTPIGTATSIVLSKIVSKSEAENTQGGIKYEQCLIDAEREDYMLHENDATYVEDEDSIPI